MNPDDFRCMRRGVDLSTLRPQDLGLLAEVYRENGQRRKALLLIHGFSSSPAVFRLMLKQLSHYDTIIVPVLPGHATSIDSFAQTTAEQWLLAVEEIAEKLVNEYEQLDVLGLSLGGLLACHIAKQFNLHHLYLLAPAIDLKLPIKSTLALLKVLRTLGFEKARSAAGNIFINNTCEIAYRQLPLPTVYQILNLIKQFDFKVPSCPTDVFLGRYDKVVNVNAVAKRFQNCEQIQIHWLENSAHVLPLDGDVEAIIAQMHHCAPKQYGIENNENFVLE